MPRGTPSSAAFNTWGVKNWRFSTDIAVLSRKRCEIGRWLLGTLIGSHGCRIEWYNFRWPWVTPNLGYKVIGSLKVEYIDGARVFNCTKHSNHYRGSTENVQKVGGRRWNFFAKSAGRCFTPLTEIKHNSVSLRWNFYADIQLIRGRLWTVKKFSEPRVSWKYLAKMWKNSEMSSTFLATLMGAAYWLRHTRCVTVFE